MNKYLLFSSIGDSYDKAFQSWYHPQKTYDIILVYYGNNKHRQSILQKYCDNLFIQKGSKYQNLVHFFNQLNILQYDYIWAVDDDIVLNYNKINKLFSIAQKYQLSICQPAMSILGRISWKHLIQHKKYFIRYTNFVEVTCPLFRQDSMFKLYQTIKPHMDVLTAWGIDYLMTYYIFQPKDPFAIIDQICVVNPTTKHKKIKHRECTKMGSDNERIKQWYTVSNRLNIPKTISIKIFQKIKLDQNHPHT